MDPGVIRAKFGMAYAADERTFLMGIDQRFTQCLAERFRDHVVLETCTGGGFTTVALARTAAHVYTVEINGVRQSQAKHNIALAGLDHRVTFLLGDILAEGIWDLLPQCHSAFLDPDWGIHGPDHPPRFRQSTMLPPADALLERVLQHTPNACLVLPPNIDLTELEHLGPHETQKLFLGESHELYCLYFGGLMQSSGMKDFHV